MVAVTDGGRWPSQAVVEHTDMITRCARELRHREKCDTENTENTHTLTHTHGHREQNGTTVPVRVVDQPKRK